SAPSAAPWPPPACWSPPARRPKSPTSPCRVRTRRRMRQPLRACPAARAANGWPSWRRMPSTTWMACPASSTWTTCCPTPSSSASDGPLEVSVVFLVLQVVRVFPERRVVLLDIAKIVLDAIGHAGALLVAYRADYLRRDAHGELSGGDALALG